MTFDFNKDGLTVVNLFTTKEIIQIRSDLSEYICNKFKLSKVEEIERYHKWYRIAETQRENALSARNRHFKDEQWKEINIVERIDLPKDYGELLEKKI